jgi:glyoxylase-like metal-dependent hydrolase (beta-lactamase superfamily II)
MRELASGVWQISGLVPNAINAYLVDDVLVDAGTRWLEGAILRALRGRELSRVALTHCHPDHQGSAAAVCRRFGVPLACHESDAAAMEGRAPMVPRTFPICLSTIVCAGPPHPVAEQWHGGETVAGFRIIPTPGHTPGHVALHREADGVAIVGDVLANVNYLTGRTELHEPPHFFSADPMLNRQAIRRVLDLRPTLLCFGHGPPLRDLGVLERYVDRLR